MGIWFGSICSKKRNTNYKRKVFPTNRAIDGVNLAIVEMNWEKRTMLVFFNEGFKLLLPYNKNLLNSLSVLFKKSNLHHK